ncbi:unnamed protein product [Penicillium pancosmium]
MQFFAPSLLLALASSAFADDLWSVVTYAEADCAGSGGSGSNTISTGSYCKDITAWSGSDCSGTSWSVADDDCFTGSIGSWQVS